MSKDEKKVGVVTHYFDKIKVAIVKFDAGFKPGGELVFRGTRGESHEPFELVQKVASMQKDHIEVDEAKKGDELGMKVDKVVKEGDEVFLSA